MSNISLSSKSKILSLSNSRIVTIQSSNGNIMQVIVTYVNQLPTGNIYKKTMGLVLQDHSSGDMGFYYNLDGTNWIFFSKPFNQTLVDTLNNKVDKITGKSLSTNDFTTIYKNQLDNAPSNTNSEISNLQSQILDRTTISQVNDRINAIIAGASDSYDTFFELQQLLEDEGDAVAALMLEISNKVDKVTGKGLSSEDYTASDKNKLTSLANYDDTDILLSINNIIDSISDLDSTKLDKDGSKVLSDVNFSISDKNKLDSLVNYDDSTLISNINLELADKVDKDGSKVLSTNDFTNDYKTQLDNIPDNVDQLISDLTDSVNLISSSIPTYLSELSDDPTHRLVTDTQISQWNDKSEFDGDYNNLSNTPDLSNILRSTDYGEPNGVPQLDESGLLPNSYLNILISDITDLIETLDTKVDKDGDKVLSTEDYTTVDKNIVSSLINIGSIYFGGNNTNSVLITSDFFETWDTLYVSSYGNPTVFVKTTDGTLYVGTDTGYLINLTNETYELVEDSAEITTLLEVHNNPNNLWIGTSTGFGYTGPSIVEFNGGDDINPIVGLASIDSGNGWFFKTDGVYVYHNNTPEQAIDCNCLVNNLDGFYYIGSLTGHIWKNDTDSELYDWTDLGLKIDSASFSINKIVKSGTRYIYYDSNDDIYYSDNNFTSFTKITSLGVTITDIIYLYNDALLLSTSNSYLYISIDNGVTWQEVEGNPQQSSSIINCLFSDYIPSSLLELGETSNNAYRGDRGKLAYDHSQIVGNPHNTVIGDITDLSSTLTGFDNRILGLETPGEELVSRTIYVETSGNDETGDGTISLPFATLTRALTILEKNIKAPIIFNFGVGIHNIYQSDIEYISNNIKVIGGGSLADIYISFIGTLVQTMSEATGTKDITNTFKFTFTGSDWVDGEFEGMFLKSGSSYHPIEDNTGESLYGTFNQLNTGLYSIYECDTTLNFVDLTNNGIVFPLYNFAAYPTNNSNTSPIRFSYCTIRTNTNYLFSGGGLVTVPYFLSCNILTKFYSLVNGSVFLDRCYIKSTQTSASGFAGSAIQNSSVLSLRNCVVKNETLNGVAFGVIKGGNILLDRCLISNYLKAFSYTHQGFILCQFAVYVKNCTYLLYCTSSVNIVQDFSSISSTIEGVTNLLYTSFKPSFLCLRLASNDGFTNIWAADSIFKNSYVSPEDGIYIQIPGIYPEHSYPVEYTYLSDTINTLPIGDSTYNKFIEVKYVVNRSGVNRIGKLLIDYDTIDVYIYEIYNMRDVGVSFDVEYDTINTSIINLLIIVDDSSVNDAIVTVEFKRML